MVHGPPASTMLHIGPRRPTCTSHPLLRVCQGTRAAKSSPVKPICPVPSSPVQSSAPRLNAHLRFQATESSRVASSRVESSRSRVKSSRVESSQSRVESSQRCLHLRFQTVMSSHVKKSEGTSCCSASVNLVRSKTWKALLAETPQSGAVPGRAVTLSSLSPT